MINLKFLHQHGMILLIYPMVLTQFLIFRIILNLLLKSIKLRQKIRKKDVDSDKHSENVPKFETLEVVLVH